MTAVLLDFLLGPADVVRICEEPGLPALVLSIERSVVVLSVRTVQMVRLGLNVSVDCFKRTKRF